MVDLPLARRHWRVFQQSPLFSQPSRTRDRTLVDELRYRWGSQRSCAQRVLIARRSSIASRRAFLRRSSDSYPQPV